MAAVIVGGVTIKVAPGGVARDRVDNVDRSRAFDGTYYASATGTAKRDWHFKTPLVPRATGDTYEATLATVAAQSCSGDIIGATVSCCSEITGWEPTPLSSTVHYVSISFVLHEV